VEISIKCQQSATLGRSNAGFDIGADDYIAKPFSVREVVRTIDVNVQRLRRICVTLLEFHAMFHT
jgi:DNA-binding response OmpR family regulator